MLREVDWDILYINNKYSQTSEAQEYLKKEFQYPKAVSREEWKAVRNTILPQERFEDSEFADNGTRNLVPLLHNVEGKGLFTLAYRRASL